MSMSLKHWMLHDFSPGTGLTAGAHTESFDTTGWLPSEAPGDLHTALHKAGRIPDPFYDRNELECAWIEEREWWYRCDFAGPEEPLIPGERLRLIFHGLDTFVTIWLNGVELGHHQNMFRPAEFDVSESIRLGQRNTLALCFARPLDQVREDPAIQPWGINPERLWMRKAQFGFGWDWGPRLPTVGIWRPVELRRERGAILSGIGCATVELDPDHTWAALAITVEVERFATAEPLIAELELASPDGTLPAIKEAVSVLGSGPQLRKTTYLMIEQPRLWWTHDLGSPALYQLRVTLRQGGEILDTQRQAVGIRTISLDQSPDPDEPGTRFFRFVLNGVPIFARGANWIPAESFVGIIGHERYAPFLHAARDAHMNMLRIWGGGIYEHDAFYDLCDQLGLLVWQDFMFACAPYPEHDPTFRAEVEAEALYQVRRLRSRACLALWCGNNENQWLHDLQYWNVPDARVPGTGLYHDLLPRIVARYSSHIPYWPGSPYGGSDHNSMEDGDRHNWDVWHGNRPFQRRFGERPERDFTPEGVDFRHYATDLGRFISEFGMHAAPVRATLHQVIPPAERFHHSPSLDHHNKDNPKNKGDNLMAVVTGLPTTLEEYIDFSMIAQAEGLKFAIEHYRRRKPHCSGTLFWQLNDCWPVLSWSVLDYYGAGKAGYYAVRRAYAPVLASFKPLPDGSVELWLTNDTLSPISTTARLELAESGGTSIWQREQVLHIDANSSRAVALFAQTELGEGPGRYLRVSASGGAFAPNRHFFAPIHGLPRADEAPEVVFTPLADDSLEICLSSKRYMPFVALELDTPDASFSDNYLELAPGEPQTVRVSTAGRPLHAAMITVRCLW
jgi:beta-mannosidase